MRDRITPPRCVRRACACCLRTESILCWWSGVGSDGWGMAEELEDPGFKLQLGFVGVWGLLKTELVFSIVGNSCVNLPPDI